MLVLQVSNLTRATLADTSGQFHAPDKSFKLLLERENVSSFSQKFCKTGKYWVPFSFTSFGSSVDLLFNLIAVPLFRREPCQHLKVDATEDRDRNRSMEVVTTIKMRKWQSCNVNVLIVTLSLKPLLLLFCFSLHSCCYIWVSGLHAGVRFRKLLLSTLFRTTEEQLL